MYHPLTPGQSWVQSPVSFRREGELETKRESHIAGDSELWTNAKGRIGCDVEKDR